METKHTKGVWRLGLRNKLAVVTDKNDSTHPTVCECNNQTIPNQEAEANAKLIATAPELLEVALAFKKFFDAKESNFDAQFTKDALITLCPEIKGYIRIAEEAITKATGN